ncbi:MAG: response regulator [Candidatus Hydrothermarchaeota archaeon]|nr:response regulator [Candidatus Hydrothermarchaeota archaeon]
MAKIMVVDDDPDMRLVLRCLLEREGYKVLEAENGEKCLREAEKKKPDLILLDIMMPGLDGWEVCRMLKESPATASIPVSMLSVRKEEEDVKKSFEYAHADAHLGKPVKSEELISTVERLFQQAPEKGWEHENEQPLYP